MISSGDLAPAGGGADLGRKAQVADLEHELLRQGLGHLVPDLALVRAARRAADEGMQLGRETFRDPYLVRRGGEPLDDDDVGSGQELGGFVAGARAGTGRHRHRPCHYGGFEEAAHIRMDHWSFPSAFLFLGWPDAIPARVGRNVFPKVRLAFQGLNLARTRQNRMAKLIGPVQGHIPYELVVAAANAAVVDKGEP